MRNLRRKFLKILRGDDEFADEVRALLLSEELLNLLPNFDRLEKKVDRMEKDGAYFKGSDRER
jgi:hypothetical protein